MVRAESPTFIFSTPTASATSAAPDATSSQAPRSAVIALAQAFSTLTIGMPGDAGVLQHHLAAHAFLPGQQAAERIADVSNIDIGGLDAGVIERTPDRRIGQRLERLVQEAPGGMGADADDGHVAHQRVAPFAGTYL